MKRLVLATAAVTLLTWVTPAQASSITFGLTFDDQGSIGEQFGNTNQVTPGVSVQNLQQLSYSGNFSLVSPFGDGTESDFTGSIDNAQLHAYSKTIVPFGGGCCGAANGAGEYWFDTFDFQPGSYSVNLVLDGTLTSNVPTVDVGALNDSLSLLENGTFIPPSGGNAATISGVVLTVNGVANPSGGSATLQLNFSTETVMVLGELLQIDNSVRNITGGTVGYTIDDADTGAFTITPLTNGASFTTASGETYSPSASAVPEPATLTLTGIGLFGAFVRHRRTRQCLGVR